MNKSPDWDKDSSPYHEGEKELHKRLGRGELQEQVARRFHKTYMPEQHRDFYQKLRYLIIGSTDDRGQPWASVICGPLGFIDTPDERKMRLEFEPILGDPLQHNITGGSSISILGIELETRRRNRVNGIVSKVAAGTVDVEVVQAFGNCPQYIQTRKDTYRPRNGLLPKPRPLKALDKDATEIIKNSDTFFVATSNPFDGIRDVGGVDVNHRGGPPGFIGIQDNKLTIPDYRGNFSFNTLGNILRYPKAGLLFIDFVSNRVLMVAGHAELHWDLTPEAASMPGAERSWSVSVTEGVLIDDALPFSWQFDQYSPSFRKFS